MWELALGWVAEGQAIGADVQEEVGGSRYLEVDVGVWGLRGYPVKAVEGFSCGEGRVRDLGQDFPANGVDVESWPVRPQIGGNPERVLEGLANRGECPHFKG